MMQLIKEGKKTQTLRLARKRLDVEENEIVKAIFPGTDKELKLQITSKGYKQFKSVNETDVELEGYQTLKELREDLKKIYPLIDSHDRLYWYRFKVVET